MKLMLGLVENKTVVITGAGRGIGKATALLFAKEGAKLFLTDLDIDVLEETVSEAKGIGAITKSLTGDVSKKEDTDKIMNEASKLGGGSIDVLTNIAGITRDRVIHKMTLDDWNFILNVNLTGTFNCIQSASPFMRDVGKEELEKYGKIKTRSIINISSTSAMGNPGQANYAASKAGIIGLTKTIAKEWARFNITCNAVAPGFIETRLTQVRKQGEDFGLGEKQKQMIELMHKETGLNRPLGEPVDVARVVLFFASDLGSYVTGQVLTVAGGMIGTI